MPERHLFINASHYQDRPDSGMRHKIASHAARYGPNGSLAYSDLPEQSSRILEQSKQAPSRKHSTGSPHSRTATPRIRQASISASHIDTQSKKDYETMLARFDELCTCADSSSSTAKSSGSIIHEEQCSLLDDYFELCAHHELPFRITTSDPSAVFGAPVNDVLVLQCSMVAAQAAIDGLNPDFRARASKQTLTLQQKALAAMQKLIAKNPTTVNDSLILSSAVLMSTAAYFDDQDAYKAHKCSLQKMINLQGGLNQTKTHRMVKVISDSAEVYLSLFRYMSVRSAAPSGKQIASTAQLAPLKLKYPMPPFAPEISRSIERLTPGFQALANASVFSVQALQMICLVAKWSTLIDHHQGSETEQKQLYAGTASSNARLIDIHTESVETQRLAAFLLLSLPSDSPNMRLERAVCLGLLNLIHSTALWNYPLPIRNLLTSDFVDAVMFFSPKNEDEEDCIIWLALTVASEWRHCAAKMDGLEILERHGYNTTLQTRLWVQKGKQLMDWIILKYEKARTFEELASLCARFFWLRRLHVEWKQTWKEAMERRLRNMPRKKSRS